MKIVVTGGAGFIGSALVNALASDQDARVVILDRKVEGAADTVASADQSGKRRPSYNVDLTDRGAIADILRFEEPDAVVHLASTPAADVADADGETGTSPQFLTAVTDYWSELSLRRKSAFRFIEAAGLDTPAPQTAANNHRAAALAREAASVHLAIAQQKAQGLPVIVAHGGPSFGPRQHPEELVPLLITNGLLSRPLAIDGLGMTHHAWLFADDHAEALMALARKGRTGQRYAISGAEAVSDLDLAHRIAALLDETMPREDSEPHAAAICFVGHAIEGSGDSLHGWSDIEADTGWRPKRDLGTALAETVAWYAEHQLWWLPLRLKAVTGTRREPVRKEEAA